MPRPFGDIFADLFTGLFFIAAAIAGVVALIFAIPVGFLYLKEWFEYRANKEELEPPIDPQKAETADLTPIPIEEPEPPSGGVLVGTATATNQPLYMSEDLRGKHLYLIGKTRTGKTTLIKNIIVQTIEQGHGVAVIDPHGDMAEEVLTNIPEHRIKDVIYFDPTKPWCPPCAGSPAPSLGRSAQRRAGVKPRVWSVQSRHLRPPTGSSTFFVGLLSQPLFGVGVGDSRTPAWRIVRQTPKTPA